MKLSKKWLSKYVHIDDIGIDTLIKDIIKHTAEVDEYSVYEGDYILDIDNKSITHRGDLWCHYGFAREIAAIYKRSLQPYNTYTLPVKDVYTASLTHNNKDCSVFYIAEVVLKESYNEPLECAILPLLDYKKIHPVIDILHYIMLSIGHPMHAYDADKVVGMPYCRYAHNNERFIGIDNKEYILTPTDMVIADDNGVIALAGIMGSRDSSVSETTKRIYIEAANFNPIVLRKTAMRLNIHTEARRRYEKEVDSMLTKHSLAYAIAHINGDCRAIYSVPADEYIPHKVPFTDTVLHNIAGIHIPKDDIQRITEALGCTYNDDYIAIPSYRKSSLRIKEDIAEEIIRLYGYDMIPSTMPYLSIKPPVRNILRGLQNDIRQQLVESGYTEIKQYILGKEHPDAIKLLSPLSMDSAYLRRSILEKAMDSIESPLRTHHNMHIFELDRVYKHGIERNSLGIIIASMDIDKRNSLLIDMQKTLSQMLYNTLKMNVDARSYNGIIPDYMHPKSVCGLYYNDMQYGIMGYIHPLKCPNNAVIMGIEIDIDSILDIYIQRKEMLLEPINTYFDISYIIDEECKIGDIIAHLCSMDKDIQSIDIVEIYRNADIIGIKKKSITLRIGIINTDITRIKQLLEDILVRQYKAHIR